MLHKSAAKSSCFFDISNKLANLAVDSNNKRHDSWRICAAARTTAFTQNEIKSWSLCSFLRATNRGIKLTFKAAITLLNNLRKNYRLQYFAWDFAQDYADKSIEVTLVDKLKLRSYNLVLTYEWQLFSNLKSKTTDGPTLLALSKSAVAASTNTLTLIKVQPNSFNFVQLPNCIRREWNKANKR